MAIEEQRKVVSPWAETTADVGSAVLGAAVGIVVGDLIKEEARKPVAFVVACLGVAAIVPAVVDGGEGSGCWSEYASWGEANFAVDSRCRRFYPSRRLGGRG